MCIHPKIPNLGKDNLDRTIPNLDLFSEINDTCDYIDHLDSMELTAADLVTLQLNVRSLIKKQADLLRLLTKANIDICTINETWLTKENEKLVSVKNYDFISAVRNSPKHGGGVGILIKQNLKYKKRPDINKGHASTLLEIVAIEIETHGKNIIVCSVYRPPNTDASEFLKEFECFLSSLKEENKDIIIGLDHNFDLIKCETHSNTRKFVELCMDKGIWPTITRPTRITKSTATLLDNILVSINLLKNYDSKILIDDVSDHLPCVTAIKGVKLSKKEPLVIRSRKLTKKNIDKIKDQLSNDNLYELTTEGTVHQGFAKFHAHILGRIDKIAPYTEYKVKQSAMRIEPWLTGSIHRCIKKQKCLYKKTLKSNKNESDLSRYKNYRNTLTKLKRHVKHKYFWDKCVEYKSNTRKLWQMINRATGKMTDKSSLIDCLNDGKIDCYNPSRITRIFGEHFSSVGKNYANAIKAPHKNIQWYLTQIKQHSRSMYSTPTGPHEIRKIIMNLPLKRSSGFDNINNILLRELCDVLCHPMSNLFNRSLNEGIFPNLMKLAEVVPLHKGSNKNVPGNYRPISLLITISKVLEKIMYKRTYQFLSQHDLIYKSQYGFRSKHSCENAIQELLSNIIKARENNKHTLVVFLDLSKAFDTLHHETLLSKLERYGVNGTCNNWYRSYLENRQMRIKCGISLTGKQEYSDYFDLEFGTPQGSCLGPLLFLVYVNDLALHLELGNSILFADDTTLYHSHTNLKYLEWCLKTDLEYLIEWFRANKLTLNLGKTICMLFSPQNNKGVVIDSLTLDNLSIPICDKTKFLGILLDNKLNWDPHFSNLVLKIKRNTHLLKTAQNLLTPHTKKTLYYGHIFSHIIYGITVWGPMLRESQLAKLQKLQNKCINLIDRRNIGLSTKYKENRLLKIKDIIQLENNKLGFKLIKGGLPAKVHECLCTDHSNKKLTKLHNYNTRNKASPNIPLAKSEKYKRSFLRVGLPDPSTLLVITECDNIGQFSRKMKYKMISTY